MCQLIADTKKMFDVSPQAFYPPPKVTSSIVHLTPKTLKVPKKIVDMVRHITQLAFSGRRKMIKSPLQKLHPDIDTILKTASIDPTARAENLTVEDYVKLALALIP